MPALRTEITEIVTGLGHAGSGRRSTTAFGHRHGITAAAPRGSPSTWDRLRAACGAPRRTRASSWPRSTTAGPCCGPTTASAGGRRSSSSGRAPTVTPRDDPVPADLRIDHVYLVSCKYLSTVLHNASPWALFDRCLRGAQARRGGRLVRGGGTGAAPAPLPAGPPPRARWPSRCPSAVGELDREQQRALAATRSSSSPESDDAYLALCREAAQVTARRWDQSLHTLAERRAMLWRLLRLSSAPYFVLGTGRTESLRLRVATPWDWQPALRAPGFEVARSRPASHAWGGRPRFGTGRRRATERCGATSRCVGATDASAGHPRPRCTWTLRTARCPATTRSAEQAHRDGPWASPFSSGEPAPRGSPPRRHRPASAAARRRRRREHRVGLRRHPEGGPRLSGRLPQQREARPHP